MGNRFGTPLAREEGRVRGEAGLNLDALISNLFLNEQGNLLNAINSMQTMGVQNTAPAFNMAQQGVHQDQTIVTDDPLMQMMKFAAPIIATAVGGPVAGMAVGAGVGAMGGGGGGAPTKSPWKGGAPGNVPV